MNHSVYNKLFMLGKLSCLAFLLFAVSTANASPTVTYHGIDLSASLSLDNSWNTTSDSTNSVIKPINAELVKLGKEFLRPQENAFGLLNNSSNSVRPLPAVPATALMLLIGFLCVSLYKDRKIWLAALAALLWVSHAGIQTLPRLAYHLSHKKHTKQKICAKLNYLSRLGSSHRSRSDIDGTRYIGLLHHLGGIPKVKSAANLYINQPALIFKRNGLVLQFYCLALKAEQFICFSPAFIFEIIPRGPPPLA
jgi:hypothetical protein